MYTNTNLDHAKKANFNYSPRVKFMKRQNLQMMRGEAWRGVASIFLSGRVKMRSVGFYDEKLGANRGSRFCKSNFFQKKKGGGRSFSRTRNMYDFTM